MSLQKVQNELFTTLFQHVFIELVVILLNQSYSDLCLQESVNNQTSFHTITIFFALTIVSVLHSKTLSNFCLTSVFSFLLTK